MDGRERISSQNTAGVAIYVLATDQTQGGLVLMELEITMEPRSTAVKGHFSVNDVGCVQSLPSPSVPANSHGLSGNK